MEEDEVTAEEPRYRPQWDPDQRCWVGTKTQATRRADQESSYIAAVERLIRAQAVVERTATVAVENDLATIQMHKALQEILSASQDAVTFFPMWKLDENVDSV